MLKPSDIYVGRPLLYILGSHELHATVINLEDLGFWLFFPDGDTCFVWYECDLCLCKPLEVK